MKLMGTTFICRGAMWKVVNWDDTDNLWICKNLYSKEYSYFTTRRIFYFKSQMKV